MISFWKSVNRVIKEADVVLEVLDARLIEETRNPEIEEKVRKEGKVLIYVINKADLARTKTSLKPAVVMDSRKHEGAKRLRELIMIVAKKKPVVVGVLGYPNVGKSSVINSLGGGGKAKVSSKSGTTLGRQDVRASKNLRLIDTPGVIPFREDDEVRHALIGSKNFYELKDPEQVAEHLIKSLDGAVEEHYNVEAGEPEEVLEAVAIKLNRLKKGGLPDTETTARMLVKAWQEGRIGQKPL